MDHDRYFKDLIVDYPREALELFAPDEARQLPPGVSFSFVRQEQLVERFGDRGRELDVPMLATFPDGQRELLAFALEVESNASIFSLSRLVEYCLLLSGLLRTRRVVPVVVFLRGRPRLRALSLASDVQEYLRFRYVACEMSRLDATRFETSENVVARLNLLNMRHERQRRLDLYVSSLTGLVDLEQDPMKQRKYLDFVDAYARLTEDEQLHLEREVLPMSEQRVMGLFERKYLAGKAAGEQEGLQKGLEQGLEQGREQGRAQGLALAVLDLLESRNMPVTDEQRERLFATNDTECLRRWLVRATTAQTVAEVLSDS